MSHHIVFLDRATLGAELRAPCFAHTWEEHGATDAASAGARLKEATIAITNKVPLRRETLEKLTKLQLVAMAATGYDVVDVAYCKSAGIRVVNIREYAVDTVPEHTFALILALRRNLLNYRHDIERGRWQDASQFCFFDHPIRDLAGATLGIVGEGSIGRATGAIGTAFGMRVLFADHPPPKAPGVEFTPFNVVLKEADVLTLHCPLTENTRNLIGIDELHRMKRSAILINTARGGLVDEAALVQALHEGAIAGAGFDVLVKEPPGEDSALLKLRMPNFILTPHIAWASQNAMQRLADQLIDNIEAFASGRPVNVVA
ncbi:MAG TPA: D-2-hydroxyacid dehydrogenase [Casimicrobiaceae bacterium]|nr:D-2-hydroxyacid dehydrogenase [Casimicrobiaceae bacterium]